VYWIERSATTRGSLGSNLGAVDYFPHVRFRTSYGEDICTFYDG
jgi:hypothetical protein